MAFRRWFPRSLQEQAGFFAEFTRAFIDIAPDLGFSADDIAKLEADNAVMQYLAQTEVSIKTFKKAFQVSRDNLTMGKGVDNPDYLNYTPLPEPPIVPYGIFDRLFYLSDRITTAKGYTSATGALLGILPKTEEGFNPEEKHLKLKARAVGEGRIEVRFVRGKSSGINLFFRRAGSEEHHDLGRFFQSPAIVKIPLVDGKPEQIYLNGRYMSGNDAVGNYSQSIDLIVAP